MALTSKQAAFAQTYLENGGNGSDAYRKIYNVGAGTKPATVNQCASRLLADPHVAARVAELKARQERVAQAAADISVEERVKTYAYLAHLAVQKGDISTAVRAQDSITKIAGLFSEARKNDRDPLTDLPRDVRDQLLALARAKQGQVH
jgi:phage terminase small subunit